MPSNTRTISPKYSTVHNWLHTDRGPAMEYRCAAHPDSDHYAETWAYNGLAENELVGFHSSRNRYRYEYAYSADINDYIPLCRLSHNALDTAHRKAAHLEDEDDSGAWLL